MVTTGLEYIFVQIANYVLYFLVYRITYIKNPQPARFFNLHFLFQVFIRVLLRHIHTHILDVVLCYGYNIPKVELSEPPKHNKSTYSRLLITPNWVFRRNQDNNIKQLLKYKKYF